jgi:hypothetical protein
MSILILYWSYIPPLLNRKALNLAHQRVGCYIILPEGVLFSESFTPEGFSHLKRDVLRAELVSIVMHYQSSLQQYLYNIVSSTAQQQQQA